MKEKNSVYPVGWDVKIRALNVATRLANIKFFQKPDARMDEIPACLRFGHANAIKNFYTMYMNKFCNFQTGGEK